MKKAFMFHVWVRRVFCVFLFILSVFFTSTQMKSPEVNPFTMYMNNPTTTTFFNAYHETFSEFQGTYVEKVQMNLYQWIEGDWIQDELWNDSFVCKYLLIQSIQSKNPLLCKGVVENIRNKEEVKRYLLLTNHIIHPEIHLSNTDVDNFLQQLEQGDVKILIPVLLESQYEMSRDQIDIVNKKILEEKGTYSAQEACTILEYNLFLKSCKNESFLEYTCFGKKFNKDATWKDLFDLYGRTK